MCWHFRYQNVWLNQKRTTLQSTSTEIRCLKQKDLIEALAKPLPPGTIRFGCHVAAISADPGGHCTLIRTVDGSTIKAKALIGCDGVKSEVSKYLGLGIASELPRLTILGLTSYPHGHPYGTQFLQLHGEELIVGRVPLNENLVHFFISRASPSKDIDVTAAKEYVLEKLKEFPADITEMVRRCDPEKELLKTLTRVWYRPPWQVLFGRFQMGTVVVAGDAMPWDRSLARPARPRWRMPWCLPGRYHGPCQEVSMRWPMTVNCMRRSVRHWGST
ncbi:unnamed protein product [Urochloa humidicola]